MYPYNPLSNSQCICISATAGEVIRELNPKTASGKLSLTPESTGTVITSLDGLNTYPNPNGVTEIDLRGNNIQNLLANTFVVFKNLKSLYIDRSGIRYIEPLAFAGLTKLENLSLTLNYITALSRNTFKGLRLKTLNISKNSLMHFKDVYEFKKYFDLKDVDVLFDPQYKFVPQIYNNSDFNAAVEIGDKYRFTLPWYGGSYALLPLPEKNKKYPLKVHFYAKKGELNRFGGEYINAAFSKTCMDTYVGGEELSLSGILQGSKCSGPGWFGEGVTWRPA